MNGGEREILSNRISYFLLNPMASEGWMNIKFGFVPIWGKGGLPLSLVGQAAQKVDGSHLNIFMCNIDCMIFI